MTNPVGKNWPAIQTVEGAPGGVPVPVEGIMGGFPVAVGGLVEVQNPAPMGLPIPLLVQDIGGGGATTVVPQVPNYPAVNRWSGSLPMDGSWVALVCNSLLPPFNFRDLRAVGDIPEYAGNFLPVKKIAYYNAEAVAVEFRVIEQYLCNGVIVLEQDNTYLGVAGPAAGVIDVLTYLHSPSYTAEGIWHMIDIQCHLAVPTAKNGWVEALLFSHYDIDGGMPS